MVATLVPVTPAMAQEFLEQEDAEVVVDVSKDSETDASGSADNQLGSDADEPTEETAESGTTATPNAVANSSDSPEVVDEPAPEVTTDGVTSSGQTDDPSADVLVASSGELAEGVVEGTTVTNDEYYSIGYFTAGVTGQTSAGTTPKVYYRHSRPNHDGTLEGETHTVRLEDAEEGITGITIPSFISIDGEIAVVKEIEQEAFSKSAQTLATVNFYDNSELKYFSGFKNSQISSIDLPSSVVWINYGAFSHCAKLTSITLPPNVSWIAGEAFCATGLTSIVVPDQVDQIDTEAFAECHDLATVELPDGLQSIGNRVFCDCEALEEIEIPDTVKEIDGEAFSGCSSLRTVNLPDGISRLYGATFQNCTSLTSIEIPDSASMTADDPSIFEGCTSLQTVKLPRNTGQYGHVIPKNMFKGCTSLTNEIFDTMPDTITTIYEGAFEGCTGLTGQLVIPDTVTRLGTGTFAGCTGITSVKLPDHLEQSQPYSWASGEGWQYSTKIFKDCTSLTSVTWPTGASFDTIPASMFEGCTALAAPSVISSIPAQVTTIEENAFKDCGLTTVDVPDNVSVIGFGAFDCSSLQSLEWPQDNGDFDTFSGGFVSAPSGVVDSLLTNLPASVKIIADDACKDQTNLTSVDLSTTSVTTIGNNAFDSCVGVASIALPNSLQSIGRGAFRALGEPASGIDIIVPAHVTSIGAGAFDNSTEVSNYQDFSCYPSTIHITNPDFVFSEWTWEDNGYDEVYFEDEDKEYANPFSFGQTIYASATNSRGEESFIHRWSQLEVDLYWDSLYSRFCTGKLADVADTVTNADGIAAYTFVWEDSASSVTVSGTVPVGASLIMTQGSGSSKVTTNVDVSDTGTFSVDAKSGRATLLRVSLPGYYDHTLTRSASAMAASWEGILVTTDQMEKIPAKSYMSLNLKRLVATDADGKETYTNVAGEDNLDYRLVDAQGHDVAFTTRGTVLTITANSDEDPDNDIAADAPLTLTVTPNEQFAKTYQIGEATVTATLADGTFDAVLPAWGRAVFTVNSADASYGDSMQVMVYKGNNLVDAGTCLTGMTFATKRLEEGTYTVVALTDSATFKTSTLRSISSLGLDGFVAQQEFQITIGTQTDLTLSVPAFDPDQFMANAGLRKAGLSLTSKTIVVGGEQTAIIDYTLDTTKTTSAEFRIMLPKGTEIASCGCSEGYRSVSYSPFDDGDSSTATYTLTATEVSQGKLYVKYRANATSIGTSTVGLSALVNGVTVPVTSNTYTVETFGMKPCEEILTSTSGSVEFFAAPTEPITFTVTSDTNETGTQTITTGTSCHKTVSYQLPGTPVIDQRYTLTASIGTKGSADYREETKQVRYSTGARVASFTLTNGDNATELVKNYEVCDGGLTILYHIKNKKYANWGFKMVLAVTGTQQVEDSFVLDVETMGGNLEQIPMKKILANTYDINGTRTTFVVYTGTFTDEVWLEAYQRAVDSNADYVWTFDWNEVFVPVTISYPTGMLSTLAKVDDEEIEELAQKRYEEWQKEEEERQQQLITEFVEAFEEGGDAREQIDACTRVLQAIAKAINEATRQDAEEEGEPVDESMLLPEDVDLMDYFTEDGLDGVTINDLLFGDEHADPYVDPTAENPEDADWYANLFGSDSLVDTSGHIQALDEEEKKALDDLQRLFDNALARADAIETEFTNRLGVENDLSRYSSWDGVAGDALSDTGVHITDLTQAGAIATMPVHRVGTTNNNVDVRDDHRGFTASDNERVHVEVSYEKDESSSWWDKLMGIATNNQIADFIGTTTSFVDGFRDLVANGGSGLSRLMRHYPQLRIAVENWITKSGEVLVRGATIGQCLNVANSVGGSVLGAIGSYSTKKDAIDAKEEWQDTYNDLENINQLITFWYSKDDTECLNKQECLNILRNEKSLTLELCDLLEARYFNLETDAGVSLFCTTIGVIGAGVSAVTTFVTGGAALPISGPIGGASVGLIAAGPCYNFGSAMAHGYRDPAIKQTKIALEYFKEKHRLLCRDCKKKKKTNTDDDKNKLHPALFLDPSGMVYEAVLSNPVEGAEVTVWRSDSADGAGKFADESFVATGQVNPQTTGANGIFQWDVTTGYYQVVVSDGDSYTGASSAWLPVTPPQLNVNLGIVSTQAPTVASAAAYTDCIEVIFSQWMQTDAVQVTGIDGATCEWADAELSGDPNDGDVTYAKVLHITKPGGFAAASKVSFGLAADGVTSYNGKHLAAAFESDELTVGQRPAQILLNIEGDEQGTATELTEQVEATDDIDAYVMDAAGKPLAGQRVSVVCGSTDLATIASLADETSTTAVTDQNGKASFNLTAQLPGMTELTFRVEDSSLTRTIDLLVEGAQVRPNRPTATITDGTTITTIDANSPKSMTIKVKAGATLTLAADEGDDIYYTTNDTCPCTEGSRTKYTTPIKLTKSTYFRIAAYNGSYDPSEGGYSAYSRRLNLTIEVTAASAPQVAVKGKTYKVGNFSYKVTNAATNGTGTVTLTKPAKTTYTAVTVPATVKIYGKSYKVTAIGAKAFLNNKKLKSVKTGSNVTSVGTSAFQGCVALTKLAVGKAVTTIGAKAFSGCKKLAKVSGGANLVTIGGQAFGGCVKLKSFSIASKALTTMGAQAFSGDKLLKTINIDKTSKLKTVTKSLKGSNVTTVNVMNSKVKAYKKLFKKAGKSVKVK